MGNCQAAEAATVVIQHPEGKVERAYWSLTASQVMTANPGHYVAAVIVTSSTTTSSQKDSGNAVSGDTRNRGNRAAASPVKHLKLLRPDDTLHIGHVYRLVSFEEVLREFASKKHVKLSRLLAKKADHKPIRSQKRNSSSSTVGCSTSARGPITATSSASAENPKSEPKRQQKERAEEETVATGVAPELEAMQRLMAVGGSSGRRSRAPYRHHAQWRPALQSIAEAGSTAT